MPRYVIVNKLSHPIIVHQAIETVDKKGKKLPDAPEQNFLIIEPDSEDEEAEKIEDKDANKGKKSG